MPLVFVHGVSVREGPEYAQRVQSRDALFKKYVLRNLTPSPDKVLLLNPYWGDAAARFAWGNASLPGHALERFGPEDELSALLLGAAFGEQMPAKQQLLIHLARQSLDQAIDLLWSIGASLVADMHQAETLADLAILATNYAQAQPHPSWLGTVKNDEQFLSKLIHEVSTWSSTRTQQSEPNHSEWERFGIDTGWEWIQEAAFRLQHSAGKLSSQVLLDVSRSWAHKHAAYFLGDVLIYLDKRGTTQTPGPICSRVLHALEQAEQQRSPDDPLLIMVGHSMGGNILYDLLTAFRPTLQVDLLLTVGSQVAVFEELKLFHMSDASVPATPQERVGKPPNVARWLNVLDYNDVLGFATAGVFDGTQDYVYTTGSGLLAAHSSYFTLPSFHRRLAERIRSNGI